jgi:O-antigen biosynthesis protein
MDNTRVALVVLSHNSWSVTEKFLESYLVNTEQDLCHLFWVDNGSTDGTKDNLIDFINKNSERLITLDIEDTNTGVAGGRNIGIEWFLQSESGQKCSHLMFLDNDQFVKRGWLEHHLSILDMGFNLVGVEAWRMNRALFPDRRCVKPSDPFTYVGGGGMLMEREVAEVVKEFDNAFNPCYFEDPDFCFRTFDAGFKIAWNYFAKIVHLPHQTLGKRSDKTDKFMKSMKIFQSKWKGRQLANIVQSKISDQK